MGSEEQMMNKYKAFIVYVLLNCALAQEQEIRVTPRVESLSLDEQSVTLVYLSPGYTTAVRMPDEISSVVVGDPAKFKAEHSESEPRLVFLKPITSKPAESNALITMKSGPEVNLHLVSAGAVTSSDPRVDFFVEYRRPKGLLIEGSSDNFFVAETRPLTQPNAETPTSAAAKPDWIAEALAQQKASSPSWKGKDVLVALGQSVRQGTETLVGFSLMNQSKNVVELLPPQLEITGRIGGGTPTRAEPIALSDYRMTSRRLAPGERTDGVAVFERPAFKESNERLELRLAQADQVDHPILVPVPFIAMSRGGSQ
jgi:hypothetical protein